MPNKKQQKQRGRPKKGSKKKLKKNQTKSADNAIKITDIAHKIKRGRPKKTKPKQPNKPIQNKKTTEQNQSLPKKRGRPQKIKPKPNSLKKPEKKKTKSSKRTTPIKSPNAAKKAKLPTNKTPQIAKKKIKSHKTVKAEFEQILKNIAKYQSKLLQIRQTILDQNNKANELNKQLIECQQRLHNKNKIDDIRIHRFKIKIQQNEAIIQKYNAQIERYKQELETTKHCMLSLNSLEEEYNRIVTEHDDINKQLQSLTTELKNYEIKTAEMKLNTDPQLKQEIFECESKMNDIMKQIENETGAANEQYNKLLEQNQQLEAQLPNALEKIVAYIPKIWNGLKWVTKAGWVMVGGTQITNYMYNKLYGTNRIFEEITKFTMNKAIVQQPLIHQLLSNNKNLRVMFEFYDTLPEHYIRHVWDGNNLISFKITNNKQSTDLAEIMQERNVIDVLKSKHQIIPTNRPLNSIVYERHDLDKTIKYTITNQGKPINMETIHMDEIKWPEIAK